MKELAPGTVRRCYYDPKNPSDAVMIRDLGLGFYLAALVLPTIGGFLLWMASVNLTSRIQSTAGGGQIIISQQTYDTISHRIEVGREFTVCLKGVEDDKQLNEVLSVDGKGIAQGPGACLQCPLVRRTARIARCGRDGAPDRRPGTERELLSLSDRPLKDSEWIGLFLALKA